MVYRSLEILEEGDGKNNRRCLSIKPWSN